MAYISSNQKDNEKDQGLDVFGGQNQTQQQDPNAQQNQDVSLTSAPGSIEGGAPAPQAPQPQQQKGSGTFTDLRKYVQANKPQAQQLSQAASQNIQKQAQQVGGQVAQAGQQYQQNIATQQQQLQQAKQFGQQQIAAANKGTMAAAPKIQEFQQLSTGQKQFGDAGALNLAAQQQAAQKVAGLAGQSERASGATNLLQEAFGNRSYTRGQKALDTAILGGDRAAREALMTGTQQAASGLDQQIRDARAAALAEASNLSKADTDFRTTLTADLESARGQVGKDIEAETLAVQNKMKEEQKSLVGMVERGELSVEDFNKYIDQSQLQAAAKQFSQTREGLTQALTPYGQNNVDAFQEFFNNPDRMSAADNLEIGGKPFKPRAAFVGDITSQNEVIQKSYAKDQILNLGVKPEQMAQEFKPQIMEILDKKIDLLIPSLEQIAPRLVTESGSMYNRTKSVDKFAVTQLLNNMSPQDLINLSVAVLPNQSFQNIVQNIEQPTTASLAARTVADINKAAQQGQDITKYLSQIDPTTITSAQAASDAALARQSALAALAGRQGEGVQRQGALPAQAATFDFAKLLKEISGIRV